MSRQAIIVDTHIVVAGLLTADGNSPVAGILDGMLAAAFPFVLSEALLAEYRTVLLRPKLRKLHGLGVAAVETTLTNLAQHAMMVAPAAGPPAPDTGDQLLWDLLFARADLLLVTGDKLLLRDATMAGKVPSTQTLMTGAWRTASS